MEKRAPGPERPPVRPTVTLVRVGGKQWVMGADPDDQPVDKPLLPDRSRVTLTSIRRVEHSSSSTPMGREWPSSVRRLKSALDGLYNRLSTALDGLFLPSDRGSASSVAGSSGALTRTSLQWGVIAGLVMGCVSLVLFHQLKPSYARPVQGTIGRSAALTPGGRLLIPAVSLFELKVGPFSTAHAALVANQTYRRRGLSIVADPMQSQWLVAGLAMSVADLSSEQSHLSHMGIRSVVTGLSWTAHLGLVSGPLAPSLTTRIDHWLSAEVGALNALTANLSDGESTADARAAVRNAAAIALSPAALAQTSVDSQLAHIAQAGLSASQDVRQGVRDQAMAQILTAYGVLERWNQTATP